MRVPNKIKYLALAPIFALTIAACGGATTESTATPAQAAENQPAATATSTQESKSAAVETSATATTQPTAAPAVESGDDKLDADDVMNNLDALDSYRTTMDYTFVGKDNDGKDVNAKYSMLQEYIKSSEHRHTRMTFSDSDDADDQAGTIDMYQMGDMSYMYNPESDSDTKCLAFSSQSENDDDGFVDPRELLGDGLDSAKLVKRGENINGVATDHYTFENVGISIGGSMIGSGEYWIAQDGKYVVRYIGKATGKSTVGSENAEGTMSWTYNLEAINALQSIELPEECASAKPAEDIPVPDNAEKKGQFGNLLTFSTQDKPADVAEFYKTELDKQDWKLDKEDSMEGFISLEFSKESRKLSVLITSSDSGTSVMINDEKTE